MPEIFQWLHLLWGTLEVDLLASRLTNQLPRYVSWKQDPGGEATNAFSLNWAQCKGYAFPPIALIGHCLKQVICQQVPSLVIVTPVWEMQSWFPSAPGTVCRSTTSLTDQPQPADQGTKATTLTGSSFSRVACIHQQYEAGSFSHQVKTASSCPPSVNPQKPVMYLLGWVSWCLSKQINPVSAPLNLIIKYLRHLFHLFQGNTGQSTFIGLLFPRHTLLFTVWGLGNTH